ncbi:hypothetical protein Tco_0313689 [Tanacetum coccineum]
MMGSLIYLTASRPDIQFLTCLCARYRANRFHLKRYSDSDYARCNMDRKSTTGACQLLGGKLVYHILKGDIELHFIPTQYQLADIFTKPLDEPTFKRLIVELENYRLRTMSQRRQMYLTLPSTPTLSPAELSGEPIMRRYRREAYHGSSTRGVGYDGLPATASSPTVTRLHTRHIDPYSTSQPIIPDYIPLEDDHEFPAEEQPLIPPIDSPTTESPGYVTESDPEEDPEEYEDDETEDGPVDYPMDGGDDGDDDDGDSSRDDARDEDEDEEDEEDEEEEEHLAPADSTVIPADEPVFPPEGTEPIIPPPSTDITIGARITIRPQTSISLPPEAEVERLLAMTTPSPSPPISLSPPSAGERLARLSLMQLLPHYINALPPPSLPPLPPSLSIPSPVDRRDDIPESEQPPRKRLHLSTICSRYEIGESSTARPVRGQGIDYGFVSTVDAEERRQGIRDVGYGIRDTWVDPAEAVPEIAPMTVGEVNTRVVGLAELHERDNQDLYALLRMRQWMTLQETVWMVEEEAYASREAWAHSIGLSQATHQELQTHRDHVYAHETYLQAHQTQTTATRLNFSINRHASRYKMVETLRVIRDMRREMSDMQAELLALREQRRRARQPGPEARIPDHQEASGDADSHIYCGTEVKYKGNDVPAYTERFQELTLICTKFVANETEKVDKYLSGLPDNIYGNVKAAKPKTLDETIDVGPMT